MQHLANTGHPPGTVIIAAGFLARYHEFWQSIEELQVPAGTRLNLARSCDVTQNFNNGLRQMHGEWAWFLGDDHAFSPDILLKLLDHQVDVVQPLVPVKVAPWRPCIMHGPPSNNMKVYNWVELSGTGLKALPKGDLTGQACMLIRKPVLDQIGDPWFECGQLNSGKLQEDIHFCLKLQELGHTIWLDQDMCVSHFSHIRVQAYRHDGQWVPSFQSGNLVAVLPEMEFGEYLGSVEAKHEVPAGK